MNSSKQNRGAREVPVNVLREVSRLLEEGDTGRFLEPLDALGAKMSWTVARGKQRLGYLLLRLALTQFLCRKLDNASTESAVESIMSRGASATDLDSAFKDELLSDAMETSITELADQVALVEYLAGNWLANRQSIKRWAGETLGSKAKTLCWKKWGVNIDEGDLTPEIVGALVALGATPASRPPRSDRERGTVSYYLNTIAKPELLHAFFSAWDPSSDDSVRAPAASLDKGRPRPVSKRARRDVMEAIREVGRNPDSWERVQTKQERDRFERFLDHAVVRYLPVLAAPGMESDSRRGSMIGGPFFTSVQFPWPETSRYPDTPLVQLDLDDIVAATGVDVGSGILQVWRPARFKTTEDRARALTVRVIPRNVMGQSDGAGQLPAKYLELTGHPDYSWRLSRIKGPRSIKGWKRFGYAVPNPDLLNYMFRKPKRLPDEVVTILESSVPDSVVELFGVPQPTGPFSRLPAEWRPLATILGPTHQAKLAQYNDRVRDISQVFFRCLGEEQFEYKGYSWRSFDGD